MRNCLYQYDIKLLSLLSVKKIRNMQYITRDEFFVPNSGSNIGNFIICTYNMVYTPVSLTIPLVSIPDN